MVAAEGSVTVTPVDDGASLRLVVEPSRGTSSELVVVFVLIDATVVASAARV